MGSAVLSSSHSAYSPLIGFVRDLVRGIERRRSLVVAAGLQILCRVGQPRKVKLVSCVNRDSDQASESSREITQCVLHNAYFTL